MKKCTKCKINKSEIEFRKSIGGKNGLRNQCRKCEANYTAEYRHTHKKQIDEYIERSRQIYRQKQNERYQVHKKEIAKYWQLRRQKKITYYQTHKKEMAEYRTNYYQLHKKDLAIKKKYYRQTLKGKESSRNQNYRRRSIYKTTDITTDWLLDLRMKTIICPLCNIKMTDIPYLPYSRHLDHIIPLNPQCGGTHTKDNVRFVCLICNLSRPKDGSDYITQYQKNV